MMNDLTAKPVVTSLRTIRWDIGLWIIVGIGIVASRLYLTLIRPVYFFDESLYLAQTLGVFEKGVMTPWSWNPGVSYLNAIWYALFSNIPLGLDYTSRFAFFLNSSVSLLLLAFMVRKYTQSYYWVLAALCIVLVSAPFANIRPNSSDSYYTVFVLLFLVMIEYAFRQNPRHWSWFVTAFILAFSATIRNDGTLVYGITTLVYLWQLWRFPTSWVQRVGTFLLVWALPMLLVLGAYWGIALTHGGFYDPRSNVLEPQGITVSERTYAAFEQGEGRIQRYALEAEGKLWWRDGIPLVRELYGTSEENDGSVFRAIANNPTAWLNRIKLNTRDFFLSWQDAFRLNGPPLFIAALWGWGLMWHYRPKSALIFLLIFFPTLTYFLITFWLGRYIINFAPLWVLLGIYSLWRMTQTPTLSERKWGIGLTILSLGAMIVFYLAGRGRDLPFPRDTMVWTFLLLSLYGWRFVWQKEFALSLTKWVPIAAFVILLIGSFRFPPRAEWTNNPYHFESVSYITHGFYQHKGERVCIAYQDLDALSLIWYARQLPVQASPNIYDELVNGTLAATMEKNQCQLALISLTGWNNRALINAPTTFSNTNANVLFKSDMGMIVLFELSS